MNLWVSTSDDGSRGLAFFLNHVLFPLLSLLYVVVFEVLPEVSEARKEIPFGGTCPAKLPQRSGGSINGTQAGPFVSSLLPVIHRAGD